MFTLRRSFTDDCAGAPAYRCRVIRTDKNRFRAGVNEYSKRKPSVVFLGDSVPFGYNIDGRDTVPSRFYALLAAKGEPAYGVINAAVPGYSLMQSIARYRAEIGGTFPVKAVVLQTYDPAEQFAFRGRRWTPQSAWLSFDLRAFRRGRWAILTTKYSFLVNVWRDFDLRRSPLDPADRDTLARFSAVNRAVLEDFARELRADRITLVLLPVNPSDPAALPPAESAAVGALNAVFRTFPADHPGTLFLDVSRRFDRLGRKGLFIDRCCHLSSRGAREQARFIYDGMRSAGLL